MTTEEKEIAKRDALFRLQGLSFEEKLRECSDGLHDYLALRMGTSAEASAARCLYCGQVKEDKRAARA